MGMYGVASHQLGRATGGHWLAALGGDEAWIVLAVWVVVFAAMLIAGYRWPRGDQPARGRADAWRADAGVRQFGQSARCAQASDGQVRRETDVG